MEALSATRFNPAIRAFHPRLLAAGKPKNLLTAAMRKLAVVFIAILPIGTPWRPAELAA